MTQADGTDIAIQRKMLRVAVRNSARSVPLLSFAVLYLGWLAWQSGQPMVAATVLALGLPVSAWRVALDRRFGTHDSIDPARILRIAGKVTPDVLASVREQLRGILIL